VPVKAADLKSILVDALDGRLPETAG
jgi:hypothetical protein